MESSFFQKIQNGTKAFMDAFNSKSCDDNVCRDDADASVPVDDAGNDKVVCPVDSSTKPDDDVAAGQCLDVSEEQAEDVPHDDIKDAVMQDADDKDLKSDSLDLDSPEVRLKTSVELDCGGYVTACSIQGRGHIMTGVSCQDYHAFEELGDGWLLAVTSDGAGSAREAARGSKANCDLATRLIKQLLTERKWKERNILPSEKEWFAEIRNVFEVMQAIIMRSSAEQAAQETEKQKKELYSLEEQLGAASDSEGEDIRMRIDALRAKIASPLEPRDFNATVIVLIVTPLGMMAAHIGDGRMGYLAEDGCWHALMTPHKGDEASATVFIPNNWNRQLNVPAFKMSDVYLPDTCVVAGRPKAFVLMSDGCESFSWLCKAYDRESNFYYDRNIPYAKFFDPLVSHLSAIGDKDDRVAELIDIINVGTAGGKRETDDRTMLLGVLEK